MTTTAKHLTLTFLALIIGVITMILGNMTLATPANATGNHKVTICHVPPGNPSNAHSITISENAVHAHIGKHGGDYFGPCVTQPTPSTKPTPSTSESPTPSPRPYPSGVPLPIPNPTSTPSASPAAPTPTTTSTIDATPVTDLPDTAMEQDINWGFLLLLNIASFGLSFFFTTMFLNHRR